MEHKKQIYKLTIKDKTIIDLQPSSVGVFCDLWHDKRWLVLALF